MNPNFKKIFWVFIIAIFILNLVLSPYIREHYPQHMTIYNSTMIFIGLIFLVATITYKLTKKE
jgi:hypothetical protein